MEVAGPLGTPLGLVKHRIVVGTINRGIYIMFLEQGLQHKQHSLNMGYYPFISSPTYHLA